MAEGQSPSSLQYLRQVIGVSGTDAATDGELLERFVQRRDEAAFAALVRRHGPMVLAVCRRVLHDAHDAEDAFQATFLVLAKKAASIRKQDSAAGWLCRVAYHVAGTARTQVARRRARERQLVPMCPTETLSEMDRPPTRFRFRDP
jgi:RNA polymerase sigma factor (sigma-70 family)